MNKWRDSSTFSDDFGSMTRHVLGDNFLVGPDTPLIRLHQLCRSKARNGILGVDDLGVDDVLATGALGRTHVVDVSSDQPAGYFFESYAPNIRIALKDNMTGRRLITSPWRALREFGMFDYHRIKCAGQIELSQIDLQAGDVVSVNRRLVVPLAGDRGQITHLLVSIVPNQQNVVPHTLQQVRSVVFESE